MFDDALTEFYKWIRIIQIDPISRAPFEIVFTDKAERIHSAWERCFPLAGVPPGGSK